jgi:hypothetical protein
MSQLETGTLNGSTPFLLQLKRMKKIKENAFNIVISMLLTGILALNWAMYQEYKVAPDKWDSNKTSHDRFDELLQQNIDKINELKIRIAVLEQLDEKKK